MAVELMQLKANDTDQGSTNNAGPTNVAVQLLQERVAAEMKENEGLHQAVRDAKADAVLLRQELVDAEARALQRSAIIFSLRNVLTHTLDHSLIRSVCYVCLGCV